MAAAFPLSTSKPALVKNPHAAGKPCGHVAFELPAQQQLPPPPPHHRSGLSDDIDSDFDHLQRGRFRSCGFSICVWACIAIFTLTIILLIVGISYIAFLRSGMPHVNVARLNTTKLEVQNSQQMDSVLELELRVSNKNEKLKLLYGPLAVDVTSEDVKLGKTKVSGFSQKPLNDTFLDLNMKVQSARANPDAVNDIKSDLNARDMVFDVYLSGNIGFQVATLKMTTVPFLSTCYEVKLTDVQLGRRSKCDVRMFAFRRSAN